MNIYDAKIYTSSARPITDGECNVTNVKIAVSRDRVYTGLPSSLISDVFRCVVSNVHLLKIATLDKNQNPTYQLSHKVREVRKFLHTLCRKMLCCMIVVL